MRVGAQCHSVPRWVHYCNQAVGVNEHDRVEAQAVGMAGASGQLEAGRLADCGTAIVM